MAPSASDRSQLVDYTYQHINATLTGQKEGIRPSQLEDILDSRLNVLNNHYEPFGRPSPDSKKLIESGSVILPDGVTLSVEETDKDVIYAISKHFQIDEVDALLLLRSFLYNEGLPQTSESEASSLVEELLEVITPFYYSERLCVIRTLTALLRAHHNADHPFANVAKHTLLKIVPDPLTFAKDVVTQYLKKAKAAVPDHLSDDPRRASQWSKQNAKEQLVLVELMFWMFWEYVPCHATIVVAVFEAAYEVEFGYKQENSTFMLDEEGRQIQRDLAALWVLLTIEVLNLELVSHPGLELAVSSAEGGPLVVSPNSLEKIHRLVMGHTQPGFACTMLAWAFFLKGISDAASLLAERPPAYVPFLREIKSAPEVSFRKGEKELHATIVSACLRPESGLFAFLRSLLTESPVFATAAAWKLGSEVNDSNAIAYRSVLKGVIMCLADYQPVELVPDFEGLIEVWIALFGHSESSAVSGLCRQFWDFDWKQGISRRGIIDFARTRFPVQIRPLIRLLRCMTGAGSSEDVPSLSHTPTRQSASNVDRQICSSYVFHYFSNIPSYSQVISVAARSGATALFDRTVDRPRAGPSSSSAASGGTAYTNLRPLTLPGGSILPQKTIGRLLCPDSSTDPVIVAWQHTHSGWKIVVDILVDYIARRHGSSRTIYAREIARGRQEQTVTLQLEDIGFEREANEEATIADILDLVLSIIQGNVAQMELLMQALEQGGPPVSHGTKESPPPDLVQIIFMILEDALSRAQNSRNTTPSVLVAPALGILSTLLSLPAYSNRIWLYLRSTSILFGSERETNFSSAILNAERASGKYVMTLSLLRLVRGLFEEAVASLLLTQSEQPRLQAVKDEVLSRAVRFVHGQVWVEYFGWRYFKLGDRFQIGREIVMLYSRVVETMSTVSSAHTFAGLSDFVSRLLLHQATAAAIGPLVQVIASGRSLLGTLTRLRRFAEATSYIALLEACLRATRLLLNLKQVSEAAEKTTLLEQMLCTEVSVNNVLLRTRSGRVNPVDSLAWYVKERELGVNISRESIRVLSSLCSSLSSVSPSPPSIIGCFTDAQATMASFVKIVRHPYDDLSLRSAIWAFICVAVEKQPALAVLLVSGHFRVPLSKGKGKASDSDAATETKTVDIFTAGAKSSSAVQAACDTLAGWSALWESNPHLLASVMGFFNVVWNRNLEHIADMKPTEANSEFWKQIASLAKEDLGPPPDYAATRHIDTDDDSMRSDLHNAVSNYAIRMKIKALALRIIGTDTVMYLRANVGKSPVSKPASFDALNSSLAWDDLLQHDFADAIHNSFDPELYDQLVSRLGSSFGSVSVQSLQSAEPMHEREFGDNFILSTPLLHDIVRNALLVGAETAEKAEAVQFLVYSVNLNMSLAHSELFLSHSWCFLLEQIKGYLRSDKKLRTSFMAMAASSARQIAGERRSGEFMYAVHGARLKVLLAILEIPWFNLVEGEAQTDFITVVEQLGGIISSENFSPAKSLLGLVANAFHQSLLQIIFFCGRLCQKHEQSRSFVRAEQRLTIGRTFTSSLSMIIDALRLTFDSARTRLDLQLDKDMQLLVAAFQQCTRPGLHSSSNVWLTKLQDSNAIGASFELLRQCDVAGFENLGLLRLHGRTLYSSHVFMFHMTLASIPFTAERLASEGLVPAYSSISITPAISDGLIDVTVPELPGERSPAHRAYCVILTNLVGVISCMASPHQFIESQVVGFVQLYGKQISRTLSWNNDDPLALPFLEELELTVRLFYLIANNSTIASRNGTNLFSVLFAFSEHALQLVQQLNYALTHPKHLVGLVEPVTADERTRLELENTGNTSLNTINDVIDDTKRPYTTSVVRRLFGVATTVLDTLTVIGGAEQVLLSDPEDWPLREALVVPHSKVTIGEPASIGTLLELGNCAYETLSFLSDLKQPVANSGPKALPQASFTNSVKHMLESVLVYASTQLVMWLSKHEDEQAVIDMEQDDQSQIDLNPINVNAPKDRDRERRLKRKSLTLADRLRRGMTGEMTMDLQALVVKAKVIIAKVAPAALTMGSSAQKAIDITQILEAFLEDRVNSSS